ncbi:histidine kinase [Caulobacter sp. D4A]|uniref:GAF domain-containing hybrid sensor histidine kinase/response regulator n=1 Tax=unclassified Caulobacter TaxID=2648921 RepID=UPI000D73DD8D|nr:MULTISPECIES: ATP-binding protein [unclassified Caulobacter]PXA92822.1 histidine kinase [Caulobacter sp. D4A]PXA96033.1 histidine kinase [Caulobacter sp. D5]
MFEAFSSDPSKSVLGRAVGSDEDFADIEFLHGISVELISEHDRLELYGKIVDAAVSITRSQFGTMQLLCPQGDPSGHGGELQLLAYRGLPPEAVAFWGWVTPAAHSSCTMALRSGRRAIIPDYEDWDEIAGTEDLAAFRRSGIRAAQTTPLRSRSGSLLGMISTHWSQAHSPSERDLRLLDILARQAADLLERTTAEEALRVRERELAHTVTALREAEGELRQLNETLETHVQERTNALLAAENQVRQMQKLEAIGQLTGGVAHDFNNLLTVIRSSAELLRRPSLPEEKRERYLDAISDTADRAAKLTAQLLAFARRQTLKPTTFDVGERIASVADMLVAIVGGRIRLTVEPGLSPCFVEADASQFETALVNMAVNARDAMDGEGELVISAREAAFLPALRGHGGHEGPFVAVAITDTGAGMSPLVLEQIFEPFFTTKGVGKGTGLGLSQVFGFAKQSGGDVDVESREGQGSTFTLYLPRVDAPTSVATQAVGETSSEAPHGAILIVEDNAEVGEFARQLLEDLGYETCLVANGQRAIAVLEERAEAFDYVFTDVVMPGISGLELGRRIHDRWPSLPVVLTSGYSQMLANDAHHGFPVLQKPYSIGELGRILRSARRLRP